ncbi:MAG: ATP-binding protein [Endomicrobiales bacterium]|nr:ATP-binding protein [Endomicrobiales bacterium]
MGIKYYIYSAAINFLTSFLLGMFVLTRDRKNTKNITFTLFCLSIAWWSFFYCLWMMTVNNLKLADYLVRTCMIGVLFMPVTFLHFISAFLGVLKEKKNVIYIGYLLSIVISTTVYTEYFVTGVEQKMLFAFWPIGGVGFHVGVIYYLSYVIYAFIVIAKHWTITVGVLHNQISSIMFGTLLGYVGGSTNYFLWYNIPIPPILNGLVSAYVIFISYAIIKYRLLSIQVIVTRLGIFLTLYALVLGVPFFVGYYTNSWLLSTTYAVIFATLGPLGYRLLQRKAEDLILAEQRRYQKILIQAASGMTKEHNLGKLLNLIVRIVTKSVKIEYAALFLEDRENGFYRLRAIRSNKKIVDDFIFPLKNPFVEFVKKHREPFLYEEIPHDVVKTINFPMHVSLVVPSFYEDSSLGFMLLGEKINQKAYSIDDINVFNILSRQTSMAIENCLFVEEFAKAQEKIFAAEKLASIGGLAEGVAHQINNRLNHFSMVSGELRFEIENFTSNHQDVIENNQDFKKTFEYLAKISDSIINNVKRTDGIVKGILNYARVEAKETLCSNFFLDEVIDLSLELLKIKHGLTKYPLAIEKLSNDIIYGVKAQVMETVYNILDNAYEAIQEKIDGMNDDDLKKFSPAVKLTVSQDSLTSQIRIEDNGMGIKPENKHKIFAPFFTTKSSTKSGTGIGMYVVKRMIEENHRGKIWFESSFGEGTAFTIQLPKKIVGGKTIDGVI